MGTHMKEFHLPLHSQSVFSKIGVVPALRAREIGPPNRIPYRREGPTAVEGCKPGAPWTEVKSKQMTDSRLAG